MTDSDVYSIDEFLELKGAIGLLSQIDWSDSDTFGELNEATHVSQTTLSKLLDKAVDEMDLLKRVPQKPEDHGHVKRYQLTRRGKKLRSELESRGVVEAYQAFLPVFQEIEEHREDLIEWITDADITDPDWPYMDSIPDDMR